MDNNLVPVQRINRQNKLPLYQQLYDILRGRIQRDEWKIGEMIPSEPELMELYGVSRITVRQVLDRLVNDGLIYRQRGRGSFVATPTLKQSLIRIISFTEDMRQRGLDPGTELIAQEVIPAPEDIAALLQAPAGEPLARLERLRLANGEPMSIENAYLVHRYCTGVLDRHDYTREPLRESLEKDYGIRLVNAKQIIRAVSATPAQARHLRVPVKSPLLFIERVSFSQDSIPIEYLKIFYRADRYSLYSELHE